MSDYLNSRNSLLMDPTTPGLVDGDTVTLANGAKFVRVSGRWEPVGLGVASKQQPVLSTPSGSGMEDRAGEVVTRGVALTSGIPFLLPSSGSVANNGALTLTTALPAAFPPFAYTYFPAGALYAGSAAGWYYTTFTSTTAGTVFAETYSAGVPAIPVTPTPLVTTGPGAYTQTINTTILAQNGTLPGGSLGANGVVDIWFGLEMMNSATAKTVGGRIGATAGGIYSPTTQAQLEGVFKCRAAGVVNRQSWNSGAFIGQSTAARVVTTEDLSTDKVIGLTVKLAAATDYILIAGIEIRYNAKV